MTDPVPSKEQIQPCPHGHTPGTCRVCMRAEIVRWQGAHKTLLEEIERQKRDMAAAVEEIRRLRAENAALDQPVKQSDLVKAMRLAGYHDWATAVESLERELAWAQDKIINRALPPLKVTSAHEREPPHCVSCSCGMDPPQPDAIRVLWNKAVIVQDGNRATVVFETDQEAEAAFDYLHQLGSTPEQPAAVPDDRWIKHDRATQPPRARPDAVAVIKAEINAKLGDGAPPLAERIESALGAADLLWRPGERAASPSGNGT